MGTSSQKEFSQTKRQWILSQWGYTFSKKMPPSSSATKLQSRVGGARRLWEPLKSFAGRTFFVTPQEK